MSDAPRPVGRFDWERLVMRAEIPTHLKTLALVIATHANRDGTNIRVGRQLLADILDASEHTVSVNRQTLVSMGFLELVKRGGGRAGDGTVNVYRLTDPGPGFLIFRLDPDGNRLIERKVGTRPKRRIDVKSASPESPVDNPDPAGQPSSNDVKPASHENSFHVKPTNDWCEAGFPLPVVTTTPLTPPLRNHLSSPPPEPVENPNRTTQSDPVRAPPTKRGATARSQPRKRRKRS